MPLKRAAPIKSKAHIIRIKPPTAISRITITTVTTQAITRVRVRRMSFQILVNAR